MLRVYKVSFEEDLKPNNTYILAISPSEAEWVVKKWLTDNYRKGNILTIKSLPSLPKVSKEEIKTKSLLENLTAWNNLPGK